MKKLGKFLAGTALGVGIGVLIAPQKGSETRKQLMEKINDLSNKVKSIDVEEVKEKLSMKIEEIKIELSELDKEKAINVVKEKGKKLLNKTDDLIKLAVEKGTPAIQKSTKELRAKTIEVLEETIAKLEASENKATKKSTKA